MSSALETKVVRLKKGSSVVSRRLMIGGVGSHVSAVCLDHDMSCDLGLGITCPTIEAVNKDAGDAAAEG